MHLKAPTSEAAGPHAAPAKHFSVGTLTYTKAGLVALFAWLLWGDFCYQLHETVVFSVLPWTFERNGAPNWLLGLLMTSMPAGINLLLNPIISTASDRTRTRWGRRMPYLAISAPINSGLLILMAFSEDIGRAMGGGAISQILHISPAATIIGVVAICFVFFRLTDMFVATVYYYLFGDIVPASHLARFMALFGVVGNFAQSLFNTFLYKHAATHMREIFLFAAVLYLVGYTFMCLKVREGKYPPPPKGMEMRGGLIHMVKMYFKECFFHRFYRYFFLTFGICSMAGAIGPQLQFLPVKSLGLSMDEVGKINGICNLIAMPLLYFAGMMADRFHPLRFMLWATVLQAVVALASINWLFWNPTPHQAWIVYILLTAVQLPASIMFRAGGFPLIVRVMPRERFGQFSAANAMVISVITIFAGWASGKFLDIMKELCGGSDYYYRFIPVWQGAFLILAGCMFYLLYREWKRLGGMTGYTPPSPDRFAQATAPAAAETASPPSREGEARQE